jgi:CheY-like chemotaxis protein
MVTRIRVLVVDDDADARELFSLVLSQAGFDVDDAADGFAALAKVSHVRPDAVLTDLRMPGMDGIDLAQRIRRIHGDVPVIIATGLETWDLCTSAEAYDHLHGQAARFRRPDLDDRDGPRLPAGRRAGRRRGDLRRRIPKSVRTAGA